MLMMIGTITFSERSVFSDILCKEDNEDSLDGSDSFYGF